MREFVALCVLFSTIDALICILSFPSVLGVSCNLYVDAGELDWDMEPNSMCKAFTIALVTTAR